MKRMKDSKTYSIQEVKDNLAEYLDLSSERLRFRLKTAWKKQATLKLEAYDKIEI